MAASADFAESAGPHCAASKATCDQGGKCSELKRRISRKPFDKR